MKTAMKMRVTYALFVLMLGQILVTIGLLPSAVAIFLGSSAFFIGCRFGFIFHHLTFPTSSKAFHVFYHLKFQIHKANDRRCPQCKKKSTVKDIRPLYASKIRVLDTSEQEALKETIKKVFCLPF